MKVLFNVLITIMSTGMKKFVKKITRKPAEKDPPKSLETLSKLPSISLTASLNNTALYSLKADQEILYDHDVPDLNYNPPLKQITGIQFTYLTSKEIENMSVIRITQPKLNGENTVSDPRLGTITNYQKCPTCSMDWKSCPGHASYIKIPPIPHPILFKQIADVLTGVCEFCHRLILSVEQMKVLQMFKYKGENRFNSYLAVAKKTVRCHHCKKPHGKYTVIDDKFQKCYKKKSQVKKIPISYEEVVNIIYNIREKDYKLLGFTNSYSHPSNMIISNLFVLPPPVIPFVESGNSTCIAAGTFISLSNGMSVPIEMMNQYCTKVLSWNKESKNFENNYQTHFFNQGRKDCIELTFSDGRKLVCTPDHKLMTTEGQWIEAKDIILNESSIRMGIDNPKCITEESTFKLIVGDLMYNMSNMLHVKKALALCRIMGYAITDGSHNKSVVLGHDLDCESFLDDIELVSDLRPKKTFTDSCWKVGIPMFITRNIDIILGKYVGKRVNTKMILPDFIFNKKCPTMLIREFIGGMLGGDGIVPRLEERRMREYESIEMAGIIQSKDSHNISSLVTEFIRLKQLIKERFDVTLELSKPRVYDEEKQHYRLELKTGKQEDILKLIENIGFRHCCHKQFRCCAIASLLRYRNKSLEQKKWIIARSKELVELYKQNYKIEQLTMDGKIVNTFNNALEIKQQLGFNTSNIYKTIRGEISYFKGYRWRQKIHDPKIKCCKQLIDAFDIAREELEEKEKYIGPENILSEKSLLSAVMCDVNNPYLSINAREYLEKFDMIKWFEKKYVIEHTDECFPSYKMYVIDKREVGIRDVYDITVENVHSFVGNGIVLKNCEDDLKYKYVEICKKAQAYYDTTDEKKQLDAIDSLVFHVKTLMDNTKNKARDPQGRRGLRCLATGTPITLSNGTSVNIENLDKNIKVFASNADDLTTKHKGLVKANVVDFFSGYRECVELTFLDGRTITCTPDHKFLTNKLEWVQAQNIELNNTSMLSGIEFAKCNDIYTEKNNYTLRVGELAYNMNILEDRLKACALCRIMGYVLTDGTHQKALIFGCMMDAKLCLDDIELLSGKHPKITRTKSGADCFIVNLPECISNNIKCILPVQKGGRVRNEMSLPEFIFEIQCPTVLIREFLAGMYGGDGIMPTLRANKNTLSFGSIGLVASKDEKNLESLMIAFNKISGLLEIIFGIKTRVDKPREYIINGEKHYTVHLTLLKKIKNMLNFAENIGFRYCLSKAHRICAVASCLRWKLNIIRQNGRLLANVRKVLESVTDREPKVAQTDMNNQLVAIHDCIATAEKHTNITRSNIRAVCIGKRTHAGGYKWEWEFHRTSRNNKLTMKRIFEQELEKIKSTETIIDEKYLMTYEILRHKINRGYNKNVYMINIKDYLVKTNLISCFNKIGDNTPEYTMPKESEILPWYNSFVIARKNIGKVKVYDLQVDNPYHSFVANGIVVHNSIKQRISAKSGFIRQNIQAKRSNVTGRSVISPDPDLSVNEVVVPPEIAKKLSYPEIVNAINMKKCQEILEQGKVSRIIRGGIGMDARYALSTRGFKLQHGDRIIRKGKIINTDDTTVIESGDDVIRTELVQEEDGTFTRKKKLIKNIEPPKRKQFQLKIGDIIEREMRDGDWVIFNRQPTLWGPGVRTKQVRIRPGKTFRFDLASTNAYNADFDGDEMNIFPATSSGTIMDMKYLMSTAAQFINEADSKPVLCLKQDNMLGGYIYTKGFDKIDKATFMDACCKTEWDVVKITDKMQHIRKVYKWTKMTEPEEQKIKILINKATESIPIYKRRMIQLRKMYFTDKSPSLKPPSGASSKAVLKTEFNSIKYRLQEAEEYLYYIKGKNIEDLAADNLLYTGHGLFSVLLPNNFEYKCNTKLSLDGTPLIISRGVFLSGTIGKAAVGNSSGSLIHHLYKDYDADLACDFVTNYQRFTNLLLARRGFSVGLEDCIPKNTDLMESEQSSCFMQAKHVMETESDPEVRESKILSLLNNSTSIGEKIAKESLDKNNNFVSMVVSGAKGSMFNITHITSSIGQQNIEGKRVPTNCNGRTLPHFRREKEVLSDTNKERQLDNLKYLFQSRGYIVSSFYEGLSPQENFFLSMGGREGLTDTSVKTSKCGYISRRILKLLEDVKISYNGTVVNSRGNIVQFSYGDDNYSASELIRTENHGYQCTDIGHVADMLNKDHEWENKEGNKE